MASVVTNSYLIPCCCSPLLKTQIRLVSIYAQQVGSNSNWSVTRTGLSVVTGTVTGSTDVRGIVDSLPATYPITSAAWDTEASWPEFDDLIQWESTAVWSPSVPFGDFASKSQEQIRITSPRSIDRILLTRADEDGEDYTYPSSGGTYAPETDLALVFGTDAGLSNRTVSDPFGAAIPAYPAGTSGHTWVGTQGHLVRRISTTEKRI